MCGNVHISDIFCQTFCQFLTTLKPITFLEENKYFNSSWHFCFLTMTEGFWKLPWYLCRYISKISETFSKCMRDVQSFLAHLCPDFQACFFTSEPLFRCRLWHFSGHILLLSLFKSSSFVETVSAAFSYPRAARRFVAMVIWQIF